MTADEIVARLPAAVDQLGVAAATLEAASSAARAAVKDRARATKTAARLDEMILEAQGWMPAPVSASVLRRLLEGLRLNQMDSVTVDDDYDRSVTEEKLELEFYMPAKQYVNGDFDNFGCTHKWEVYWADCYGEDGVAGRISCQPFLEDPPYHNNLYRCRADNPGQIQRTVDEYNKKTRTVRSGWQLKLVHGLREQCEKWRRGAGLKTKELGWEDTARAVCAAIGMLARDEESNKGQFVLKRLMLCLEKEMRALKNPGFDKTALSPSEQLRKYGGLATSSEVIASLKHEGRWDRNTKYPRSVAGAGAAAAAP
jgi:hypothetical protein